MILRELSDNCGGEAELAYQLAAKPTTKPSNTRRVLISLVSVRRMSDCGMCEIMELTGIHLPPGLAVGEVSETRANEDMQRSPRKHS